MFSCACSFRHAQCAALIALATAAGIPRIELARAVSPPRPASEIRNAAARTAFPGAQVYNAVFEALAPWLNTRCPANVAPVAADAVNGQRHAARAELARQWWWALMDAPAHTQSGAEIFWTFIELLGPKSSMQKHQFPWALGPPPRGMTSIFRADDAWAFDDFSACGTSASQVVALSSLREERTRGSSPRSDALNLNPSFASCGKPGFLPTRFFEGLLPARSAQRIRKQRGADTFLITARTTVAAARPTNRKRPTASLHGFRHQPIFLHQNHHHNPT